MIHGAATGTLGSAVTTAAAVLLAFGVLILSADELAGRLQRAAALVRSAGRDVRIHIPVLVLVHHDELGRLPDQRLRIELAELALHQVAAKPRPQELAEIGFLIH